MINKYPGTCGCGVRVLAGEGEAYKADGRWAVRCAECAATQPAQVHEHAGAAALASAALRAPADATDGSYALLSGHPASPYQAAVFDHFRYGTGSVIVNATAGSGKTTTMKNALRYLPERAHVQLFAFNTEAAGQLKDAIVELEALGEKTFRNVRAGTFHSVGYGAIRRYLKLDRDLTPDPGKCRKLLRAMLGESDEGQVTFRLYGAFATQLVGLAKGEGIGALTPDLPEAWWRLVEHHGLYLDSEEADPAIGIEIARTLLAQSNGAAREGSLDYDDMLYLVCLWKLRLWRNDVVVADECFVPETPVLVGLSGEQRTIKDLYENGYGESIVTWSEEKGTHLSRIIGVKRIPVGKPMVRIRTRQLSTSKNHPGIHFNKFAKPRTLVCTVDHKIWTKNGWIAAGDLTPSTIVKHESIAPIVRSYQSRYAHTQNGRIALSEKADHARFGGFVPGKFKGIAGGNGYGMSRHEKLMLERLGEGWQPHYVVSTGSKKTQLTPSTGYHGKGATYRYADGIPTNFKLDLANPERMIAVELDGSMHGSLERQAADARKTKWLEERGWTVIRFKNEEVRTLTDEEMFARLPVCPVDAKVISVEPWTNRKHEYVYDLTVEDTHCYFAHGLLVHNCQDTNPVRRAMLHLALKDGGRLYAVGDRKQSIYGFTGASTDAIDLIQREFDARELPLTVSYRCARSIVERAQTWVPYIEPAPGAPDGEVLDEVPLIQALTMLGPDDAMLCRQTAPLVTVAYGLIARGRACRIMGREIGEGLVNLIEQQKARGISRLVEKLEAFRKRETAKFIAKGEEGRAEAVGDRVDCILVIAEALPETERTVPALVARIRSMFVDDARGERQRVLTLCTAHKAKGREWNRVAILRPDLMPSRAARQAWQISQELNLCYVAATRAKETLIYVRGGDMQIEAAR